MTLSPAEFVIKSFGGVRATARAIGRSASSVAKWKFPKSKRGCDGNIPSKAQREILQYAKKHGLDISPDDLAYGRKVRARK